MQHLKELREARNLLQKDVALNIRVDRTTYAKYEAGTSEPSFEILGRLCVFYNVSADYLIFGRDFVEKSEGAEDKPLLPDEEKILKDYRSLNDQGKQYIQQTMEMTLLLYIKHYKNVNLEKNA